MFGDPSHLFAADEAGHQQSEVEVTLHFRGVEKSFAVPGQHLQELLDVYGLLQHLDKYNVLPGAIFPFLELLILPEFLCHVIAKTKRHMYSSIRASHASLFRCACSASVSIF